MYNQVIPLSLQVVSAFAHVDETKAIKIMEFLDGIIDCVIQVALPHIKTIVSACISIAKEASLGDELRIKGLSFIGDFVSRKKKVSMHSRNFALVVYCIIYNCGSYLY